MSLAHATPLRMRPPARGAFEAALIAGLRQMPKRLPCKYFYDRQGSLLFEQICRLREYYPTRTETALLRTHATEMAALIGEDAELVEFGAGSLQKVGILLDAMTSPRRYVPIDISSDYLTAMAAQLGRRYPGLSVKPHIADFTQPICLPAPQGRRVGFFPGSTIGNFERAEAIAFLRRAAALLKGSGLLIGADLVKDPAMLHAAYNDAAGITAAFNKNILARANREADADFDLEAFAHYAFYEPRLQRVEMHLVSLERQRVGVAGVDIGFEEGETIHTENSHKYTIEGFRELTRQAGFVPRAVWCDPAQLFSIHWLEA